ncbi:hypothetical protein Tco_1129921 [Tanacetum coccineum]
MTTRAEQIAKDNALVAPENRRAIGKCNMRVDPKMKIPSETTYQVVMDSLAISLCYPAFLITSDVPTIYMHKFWHTVYKHGSSYRFKIENKKFAINVEVFGEILNICPRIEGQEFTDPPYEEEALSFIRHLDRQQRGKEERQDGILKFVSKHEEVQVYGALMPQEMKNPEMSSEDTPTRKSSRIKRSAKVSPTKFKKKAPAKDDTGKGLKVLSEVALSEEEQLNEVLKRSRKDTHSSQASDSGAGTDKGTFSKPGVPDVPKDDSESEIETWGDSNDDANDEDASGGDGNDDDDDDEKTKSDDGSDDGDGNNDDGGNNDEGNDDDSGNDDDGNDDNDKDGDVNIDDDGDENVDNEEQKEKEEENADKHVPIPEDMVLSDKEDDEKMNEEGEDDYKILYRDVNVNLQRDDVDMTNANQGGENVHNVSQDTRFDFEDEDTHVTITKVHDAQKAQGQEQSSSVSSDFTSKLLNLENVSQADYTIASVMDTPAGQITSTILTITPALTILEPTSSALDIPDFASMFKFN